MFSKRAHTYAYMHRFAPLHPPQIKSLSRYQNGVEGQSTFLVLLVVKINPMIAAIYLTGPLKVPPLTRIREGHL